MPSRGLPTTTNPVDFTAVRGPRRSAGARSRAAALVAAAVVVLSGCAAPAAPTEGSITIRVGSLGGIASVLDPFQGGLIAGDVASRAVYEPLVEGNGGPTPRLAESFEVSEDGLTVTMTLPEDVFFTDGEHLDAPAVADYLTRLFATDTFAYKGLADEFAVEVVATDDYALEFALAKPAKELWWFFIGDIPIISPAAVEDPSLLEDGPIGTGPYVIDEISPEVSISFVRNPDYRDPEAYDFDRVTMAIYDDDIAALNAMKTGVLDAATIGDAALIGEAKSAGLSVSTGVGYLTYLFFIGHDGEPLPALGDIRVRKAINLAFDREAIDDALIFGLGKPFDELGDFLPKADYIDHDPELARELLAEAGYPDGLDLTISSTDADVAYQPVIVQSLSEIGVRVTFDTTPSADTGKLWLEIWPSRKFPVSLISFLPDTKIPPLFVVTLYGGYSGHPELEELYEVFTTGTPTESAAAEAGINELLLEKIWYAPIANRPTFYVSRPGFDVNPSSEPTASFAFLDEYTAAE